MLGYFWPFLSFTHLQGVTSSGMRLCIGKRARHCNLWQIGYYLDECQQCIDLDDDVHCPEDLWQGLFYKRKEKRKQKEKPLSTKSAKVEYCHW